MARVASDRSRCPTSVAAFFAVLAPLPLLAQEATIPVNRDWEMLPDSTSPETWREGLAAAGSQLGDWSIHLAGVDFDGYRLAEIASTDPGLPFQRVLREQLRRPVDVLDFLLFLDDVLVAGESGQRGRVIWMPAGRARAAGVLLHPDDVFFAKPRLYADGWSDLNVDKPAPPMNLSRAKDGELLGPNWILRYPNPTGDRGMIDALRRTNPSDFSARVTSLLDQLRAQGADVHLAATVRNPVRGYLMWGAFVLSRADDEGAVKKLVKKLERVNRDWGHRVPIRWAHPDGWLATVESARLMADAYDVVFATESGARKSKHYDGCAVDITVMALPPTLTLKAPNGAVSTFDLSGEEQSRDLSLTPDLIDWVEKNFAFEKLESDHPHWQDVVAP
jgi:hypothetical protein